MQKRRCKEGLRRIQAPAADGGVLTPALLLWTARPWASHRTSLSLSFLSRLVWRWNEHFRHAGYKCLHSDQQKPLSRFLTFFCIHLPPLKQSSDGWNDQNKRPRTGLGSEQTCKKSGFPNWSAGYQHENQEICWKCRLLYPTPNLLKLTRFVTESPGDCSACISLRSTAINVILLLPLTCHS